MSTRQLLLCGMILSVSLASFNESKGLAEGGEGDCAREASPDAQMTSYVGNWKCCWWDIVTNEEHFEYKSPCPPTELSIGEKCYEQKLVIGPRGCTLSTEMGNVGWEIGSGTYQVEIFGPAAAPAKPCVQGFCRYEYLDTETRASDNECIECGEQEG